MSPIDKARVAAAFGQAAARYDESAGVQRRAGKLLAETLRGLFGPSAQDFTGPFLEIGAGTGGFTRELLRLFPQACGTVTDLSPDMIRACRADLDGNDRLTFQVMDGDAPEFSSSCDLIVSNLAFQWFPDLPAAVGRLRRGLSGGGQLVFSTLGGDTFREWREVLAALDLPFAGRVYPDRETLKASCGLRSVERHVVRVQARDGFDFLRSLKAIGAATPKSAVRSLDVKEMRHAVQLLEQRHQTGDGFLPITYEILIGVAGGA